MPDSITSMVLAGGKSTRLGTDKALLTLCSGQRGVTAQTMMGGIVEKLLTISKEIIVVGDLKRGYEHLKARLVSDVYPGAGSLGGIYSGLQAAIFSHALVVACDMPFLNVRLLRYMISLPRDYDVLIPKLGGRLEPLHAIYSKNCLSPIEGLLRCGDLCILDLFDQVRVRYVAEEEIERYDPKHLSFFNINTPSQLREAEAILERNL